MNVISRKKKKGGKSKTILVDVLLTMFLKPTCDSFGKNVSCFTLNVHFSLEELQEFMELKVGLF